MRVRTNIIISEDILAKIDLIAGEKQRRATVIETALREFIEREESKAPLVQDIEMTDETVTTRAS